MRQIHDNQYSHFTPKERLNLTLAALARGDEVEATKLWQTCPRFKYVAHDFEYALNFNTLIILNSLFFEKCVQHYNAIKKLDEFTFEAEDDLTTEQYIKSVKAFDHPKDFQIAQLKGLVTGFKLFCNEVNLEYENVINATSIKNCCHDIQRFLEASVITDLGYAQQMKEFFLNLWSC